MSASIVPDEPDGADSVVAIYGRSPGLHRQADEPDGPQPPSVQRLGAGRLVFGRFVLLSPELSAEVSSADPPRLRRVGIAGRVDGRPFVEVIEIRQVVEPVAGTELWGAELWETAQCPPDRFSGLPGIPEGGGPANGWCFFFPTLSIC